MEIFGQSSEIIKPVNSFQMILLILIAAMIAVVIFYIKTDLSIKSKLKSLQEIYDNIIRQQNIAIENINNSFKIISNYIGQEVAPIKTDKLYYSEEFEMYLGYISDLSDANYIDDRELRICASEVNKATGLLQKETDHFIHDCKNLFVDNSSIVGRVALEVHKSNSIENYHKLKQLNKAKDDFSNEMTRKAQQSGLVSSKLSS